MASEVLVPEQNHVETKKEGDQSKQSDDKPGPNHSPKANVPPTDRDSTKTKEEKEYRLNQIRFLVEIFTLVAIAFYGWVAYWQWDEMRKSTDAAKRAADVTEATLKSVTDSSHLDQRAWIGINWIGPLSLEPNKKATIPTWVKNSGKTPALDVDVRVQIDILPSAQKFRPRYGENASSGKRVFQPQVTEHLVVTTRIELGENEIRSLEKGHTVAYASGKFTYSDIFGNSHFTEFCWYYRPTIREFSFCFAHNEAN